MGIPEDVLRVWDKYDLPENVRRHCIKVAEIALRIAERVKRNGHDVDLDAVKRGALLHDLGRAITHEPFRHFIISGELLRKEGFDEKIVRIAERHFSAGVTEEDAKKLGLEVVKSFMPETIEEKVVCYADKVTKGDREIPFEEFLKRLDELEREYPETAWFTKKTRERIVRIKEELEKLAGIKL